VGREEDAAQSVFRLVPRPLMEDGNRRLAQDGLVLRFVAQLVLPPGYPAHMLQDAERRCALCLCMHYHYIITCFACHRYQRKHLPMQAVMMTPDGLLTSSRPTCPTLCGATRTMV
jgi:hypothetical protein